MCFHSIHEKSIFWIFSRVYQNSKLYWRSMQDWPSCRRSSGARRWEFLFLPSCVLSHYFTHKMLPLENSILFRKKAQAIHLHSGYILFRFSRISITPINTLQIFPGDICILFGRDSQMCERTQEPLSYFHATPKRRSLTKQFAIQYLNS